MQRLSDWSPARTTPAHTASWLPGDLLILLLAVCAVLFAVNLASPALPATYLQFDAQNHPAPGHAVTLITPLHLTESDLPTLPGLALANATHAALPPESSHKPGHAEPPPAPLLDDTDLDTLGKDITVITDDHAIRFRISSDALFAPAQAKLTLAGLAALQPLASILSRHHASVSVEGHADAIPIRNPRYPSNWELSASRAASVLRYLEDHGIAPERLHASGYAHTRPIADNDTADGRATNRRVEIVVTLAQRSVQTAAEVIATKPLIMQAPIATPSARHTLPPLQPPPPRPA